jgi:hypothetical protein
MGNTSRAHRFQIVNLLAGYMYFRTAVPCVELFNHGEDSQHDTDCDPGMLTDEEMYTG